MRYRRTLNAVAKPLSSIAFVSLLLIASIGDSRSARADTWALPNAVITPGSVVTTDPSIICVHGYSRSVRPPYDYAWRRFRVRVFRAYGIPHDRWRQYTLDHLIPLSIGGAPEDIRNVWPEPRAQAKEKDEVEDALLKAACYRHTISITAAQAAIAHNWDKTPVGLPSVREHHYDDSE